MRESMQITRPSIRMCIGSGSMHALHRPPLESPARMPAHPNTFAPAAGERRQYPCTHALMQRRIRQKGSKTAAMKHFLSPLPPRTLSELCGGGRGILKPTWKGIGKPLCGVRPRCWHLVSNLSPMTLVSSGSRCNWRKRHVTKHASSTDGRVRFPRWALLRCSSAR